MQSTKLQAEQGLSAWSVSLIKCEVAYALATIVYELYVTQDVADYLEPAADFFDKRVEEKHPYALADAVFRNVVGACDVTHVPIRVTKEMQDKFRCR